MFANYWHKLIGLFTRKQRSDTGTIGEDIAANHLRQLGYRIVERNWRCRIGELDIVCIDRETLVLAEVKSSKRLGAVAPEDRVGAKKRRKLRSLAAFYMKRNRLDCPVRFDIVAVWWEHTKPQVRHIQDAFHGR